MTELLTIIIPTRETEDQCLTLKSLSLQTFQDFKIIISYDQNKGACFARNQGFVNYCDTKYVLFSDNDIIYEPDSLEVMIDSLENCTDKNISYVYGWYIRGENDICGNKPFNINLLKKQNFISTMSILKSRHFPGFDEKLQRLQDWDLWLNLLINYNKTGLYINKMIFKTPIRKGITHDGGITYTEASNIVKRKYNL